MQEIWHQSVLFEAQLDIFHLWSILESEHLRHWHTHHSVHAKSFLEYIFYELSIEKIFLKCHCAVLRTLKFAVNQYLLHEFLIKTWHWHWKKFENSINQFRCKWNLLKFLFIGSHNIMTTNYEKFMFLI